MYKKSRTLSRLGIFLVLTSVISFIVFYFVVMLSNQGYTYVDVETMELVQTQEIKEGAPVAVIETTYGEIRAVLYPEYAPKTVENFIALVNDGYYDDTYVFEQKEEAYFAAGTPNADGSLSGNRETNELVPLETHQNLWPFKGALCVMNTSVEGGFFDRLFQNVKTYTGSRFMVLGSVDFSDEEFVTQFREASGSEELADAFIERGGVPNFAQQLTVFGQAYEGIDVIEEICAAEIQAETNISGYTPPVKECKILKITMEEYHAE